MLILLTMTDEPALEATQVGYARIFNLTWLLFPAPSVTPSATIKCFIYISANESVFLVKC